MCPLGLFTEGFSEDMAIALRLKANKGITHG